MSRPYAADARGRLFSRFGQGHHIRLAQIVMVEIIAQRRQDFLQIRLQPADLDLRRAFFGLDIVQPAAQLVTGGARERKAVGCPLYTSGGDGAVIDQKGHADQNLSLIHI